MEMPVEGSDILDYILLGINVYEINHMNCGNDINDEMILIIYASMEEKPEKKSSGLFFMLPFLNCINCEHHCKDNFCHHLMISIVIVYV